ncbi:MAG: LysR family transcriptional regulator [Limimaricola sp.]|uniref:LysR family transcriptional regulator n=1 Tax=Limimaricola sp. TaxID=2211665 RepID=UPI001DB9999E|nr:LysR family transcriptional regulator [Limimaricola sp.]MBI1415706.1 LysR family transcriptional regulator [Limimaricola sp.]
MISRNLRHFRLVLAVADLGSVTEASAVAHVTQPAVTQAIAKIEREAGGLIFDRGRGGLFLTPRGEVLTARLRRAFALLDPALEDVAPRLKLTVTSAQLKALIAVREAENFTLAAQRMGMSQPTVHRAVTQIEAEAGRRLFERTAQGVVATRPCAALAQAGRLAFYELDQAEADLAEFEGREVGRIVIGSMPLSRSVLLPKALAGFRAERPRLPVRVLDGPYDLLLAGLLRGEIDFLVGALRDPAPLGEVMQRPLFDDQLALIAGLDHPLAGRHDLTLDDLARYPWIVPRAGTPTRVQFDALFAEGGIVPPASILECGSILLMREMLGMSDHLGCISRQQANAEIGKGLVRALDFATRLPARPIGLTLRTNWEPTAAQRLLLDLLQAAVPG